MLGQVVISLSQPIFVCAITLISNKWFPDNERDLISAIFALSVPAGNLLAFLQTGVSFRGITDGETAKIESQLA